MFVISIRTRDDGRPRGAIIKLLRRRHRPQSTCSDLFRLEYSSSSFRRPRAKAWRRSVDRFYLGLYFSFYHVRVHVSARP